MFIQFYKSQYRQRKQRNVLKLGGFVDGSRDISESKKADTVITLSDKRLLDMEEFSIYASVGICTSRELAKKAEFVFRCGNRVLVV